MKSLDNLTLMQIMDKYRDIIGEDFEDFICTILNSERIIHNFKDAIDSRAIKKNDKKEREKIAYKIIKEVLEDNKSKFNNDNDFKRKIIAEIIRKYPERIKSGTKQEMKKFVLNGNPIEAYEFPSGKYIGMTEYQIITEDDKKSVDSIYDEKQRKLFKSIIDTIALPDIDSIFKSKYAKTALPVMMRNIAIQYFIDNKRMTVREFKKLYEEDEIVIDDDDKKAEEEIIELAKEYITNNFQLIDREALLLNTAAKLMLGLKVCSGEKINNVLPIQLDEEEKREKVENSILSLKRIYRELLKGKYNGETHAITDDDGNIIIETDVKDLEKFLLRCTDTKYLSDLYINKLRENLANGVFPEDLEELKIAGVGLEDVTNIVNNYEGEENEENKEKLLASANAFVKYLLRNSDVKKEDVIDLYINGNANLELIKTMELDELSKEYFDTRFVELFGEDVYLDTPESNAKLKRYGNLYAMLKEQNQIDTTTDDLVEMLSTMFGEEFIPNIMGELYKIGVANIEEVLQWLGGEFLKEQYEQENLRPVEIRRLYDNGTIKHDELISMIKLLKDNTEKFMVISSLFPEQESIDIRQELSERCLDLGESAKEEEKGVKRKKKGETSNDYDKYITDPVSRFMLMKLLDKEFSFKITSDGHAVMYLPDYEKVIIEKMLDKNGKPYYGAATYVLDEDFFEKNKSVIVEKDKIRRGKLSEVSKLKSVEKLIHSATGWGKGIKKVFGIDKETKTPEELEQIEKAIKEVEESRRKIERE